MGEKCNLLDRAPENEERISSQLPLMKELQSTEFLILLR